MKNSFIYLAMLFIIVVLFVASPAFAITSSSEPVCTDLKFNMRFGSKDYRTQGEVTKLQDFLRAEGYLKFPSSGYLGYSTARAILLFRKDYKLNDTVLVGTLVRAKVKDLTCNEDLAKFTGNNDQTGGFTTTSTSVASSQKNDVVLTDNSLTDGSIVTYLKVTLTGAGPNLKACTTPDVFVNVSTDPCSDANLVVLTNQEGWSYNAQTDTYSIDMPATKFGFPAQAYRSVYLLSNGTKVEKKWTPGATTPKQKKTFLLSESSLTNGSIVTQLRMKLTGAGSGLKACTTPLVVAGPVTPENDPCRDSKLVTLTGMEGWSYNAQTDTYSIDMSVSQFGYPVQSYRSVYLLNDGTKVEKNWVPGSFVTK